MHAVDDEAEASSLRPQHRDDDVAVVPLGRQPQDVGQPHERQQLAAQPVDLRTADLLDGVRGLLGVQADQLLQADLRDGVAVAGALDGQGRDDREGQRDAQPADGAAAGLGLDLDGAADGLDVGLDDVHADTATGDVRDGGGRREPGQEDQLEDVGRAHPVELGGGDQAPLDGLVAELRPGRCRRRRRRSRRRPGRPRGRARRVSTPSAGLPAARAGLGRLDAVVDRVADEVGQRVLDRLEQGLVELGLVALHLEADLTCRSCSPRSRTTRGSLRPDVVDRLHARLHDALLQLAGDQVQPLRRRGSGPCRSAGATFCTIWLRVSTSSPTSCISSSSRSTSTRMVLSATARRGWPFGPRPRTRRPVVAGGASRGRLLDGGLLHDRLGHGGGTPSDGSGGRTVDDGLELGLGEPSRGGRADGGLPRCGGLLRGRCGLAAEPWRRPAWQGPSSPAPSPRRPSADGRGAGTSAGDAGASSIAAVIDATTVETSTGPSPPLASIEASSDADGVDHLQQHARARRGQRQLAVPQPGEHVLADVGDLLEPVEGQEAAGALDRVDRPEDARQPLAGVGVLLEGDQVGVELVEVLVTLDQELLDDVVQTVHGCCLLSRCDRARAARLGHR